MTRHRQERSVRWLTVAAATLLLILGFVPVARTQDLPPSPGLQRAVARLWTAPVFVTEETTFTEYNDLGTPVSETSTTRVTNLEGTPIATPDIDETASGLVFLVVAVFEYDTADNAAAAYVEFAPLMDATVAATAEFAGVPVTALDAGDEAIAAFATGEREGVPLSFAFALVRDDRYVYQVQGQFARLDAQAETVAIVDGLASSTASETVGEFDLAGGSTGGLWDKFANVAPPALPGTTIVDAQIYPVPSPNVEPPSATPAA